MSETKCQLLKYYQRKTVYSEEESYSKFIEENWFIKNEENKNCATFYGHEIQIKCLKLVLKCDAISLIE